MSRSFRALLLLGSLFASALAFAELGGDTASVQRDQQKIKGVMKVQRRVLYSVHEISSDARGTVREFVRPDGKVFAVAWRGQFHPDYQQLLGAYFSRLQQPGARQARRAPVMIDQPDFVFQSFGHFRSLAGRAYVKQMLPAGVSVEELQ